MRAICCGVASLILFIPFLSYSQDSISPLDTVVIATSRVPVKIKETGRFVTVIDQQALKNQAVVSLDEVLRYVPGIEVQSRNAFGAQSDISMRGSTFTQVLVLVDGMRLNDPLTAHFNGYIPIPAPDIYRIEVLRGPAVASFGPDAVGGVINIITKTFARTAYQDKSEAEVSLNYGEENLINGQAGFSRQNEKGLKWSVAGSINKSDGQTIAEQNFVAENDTTTLEAFNNYFDIKNITVALSAPLRDQWRMSFRSAYDYRDFSARYFYTSSPFDQSVEKTTNFWNHLRIANERSNGQTTFDAAYKRNTDEFIFNPAFTGNNHTTQLLNFQLNHYRVANDRLSWNVGFQADQRQIESNDRGNHEDWHFGSFFTSAFKIANDWNLQGSLRLDYDENYGWELSPQFNLSLVKPAYVLRSTMGRSIRAADYTERYVSNNLPGPLTPGRNLGNPNLQAEQSWSFDIGGDLFPASGWRLSATSFVRFSDRLIDYALTNQAGIFNDENLQKGADYFYARNVEDVQTFGFEVESNYKKTISDDIAIILNAGYTWLDTQNDDGVTSVYISNHARHLITTNIGFETGRFNLFINGLYKVRNERSALAINSRLEEQYLVWHGRVNYRVWKHLSLNFQVHNLFDEVYQDILGAPMPGRWILGGLKFQY